MACPHFPLQPLFFFVFEWESLLQQQSFIGLEDISLEQEFFPEWSPHAKLVGIRKTPKRSITCEFSFYNKVSSKTTETNLVQY
jgi:hypothetical protein